MKLTKLNNANLKTKLEIFKFNGSKSSKNNMKLSQGTKLKYKHLKTNTKKN